MAELPDISGGETITSAFTNDVKNRTVMRYANAAARDASIPVPVSGNVAWLDSTDDLTIYSGSSWIEYVNQFDATAFLEIDGTNAMTGDLDLGNNELLNVATDVQTIVDGATNRVFASISSNVVSLDFQGSAVQGSLIVTMPVALRPATGNLNWPTQLFTAGFGPKQDEYGLVRLFSNGQLSVQQTSAGQAAGDLVIGSASYVIDVRGI